MPIQPTFDRFRQGIRRLRATHLSRQPVALRLETPVISFTFDDFPASAYQTGGAILEKYGLRGTYYTSLGLADKDGPVGRYFSESVLPELLARGHELGCHTYDHCHAWRTAPQDYRQSIIRNCARLQHILPTAKFTCHSYPIDYPRPRTKTITSEYFTCARGGEQRANRLTADANYLNAFFIEKSRDNLPAIKSEIDRTKAAPSWLIFATHDVCSLPSPFGCTPELFEAIVAYTVQSAIPVLPVSHAFAQLRGPNL